MLEFIYDWLFSLGSLGVEPEMAKNWIAPLLVGLCILALSVIADFAVKRIALRTLKSMIARNENTLGRCACEASGSGSIGTPGASSGHLPFG